MQVQSKENTLEVTQGIGLLNSASEKSTSSTKATPSKSLQTVSPVKDEVFRYQSPWASVFIETITIHPCIHISKFEPQCFPLLTHSSISKSQNSMLRSLDSIIWRVASYGQQCGDQSFQIILLLETAKIFLPQRT